MVLQMRMKKSMYQIPESSYARDTWRVGVAQQHPENLALVGRKSPCIQLEVFIEVCQVQHVVHDVATCAWVEVKRIEYGRKDFVSHLYMMGELLLAGCKIAFGCGLVGGASEALMNL
jgi:hypothetical protein